MYALVLALGACQYSENVGDEKPATEENDTADTGEIDTATDDTAIANAAFSVVIESNTYGATLGRCQVEVAFYEPSDEVLEEIVEETGDTGEESEYSTVLPIAETPGTCVYAKFDPDAELSAITPELRGTLGAGDEVSLDDANPITLKDESTGDGGVRYAMPDCGHDTFPFSRTFGISAGGDPEGVPAFSLSDAVAVGPDVAFTNLPELSPEMGITVPAGADFEWTWENLGAVPMNGEGVELSPDVTVTVMTARTVDNHAVEALSCRPAETGKVVIDAETLALLIETRSMGDQGYSVVQLNIEYRGDTVDAPWGELMSVRSRLSLSGLLQIE